MKFPRNARIFRGQLDAAPFAAVFFLLIIFLMLSSRVYTPGVRLRLPVAGDLPGTDKPTVAVAIDAQGRLYYENRLIGVNQLADRLRKAAAESPKALALIVQADQDVRNETLVKLAMLAREAGLAEAWLATLPRPYGAPDASRAP
jgi:biopolymer transport protein ExbD